MQFDHIQFHMALRQEQMTRTDRLQADEQLGRMAYQVSSLVRAVRQAAGDLRHRAQIGPRPTGATMRTRRSL